MKNTIKLLGIIALAAIIGLAMVACGGEEEAVTITVTGDFAKYNGWSAGIKVGDANVTAPLVSIAANATSLVFEMPEELEPGTHGIVFWFQKVSFDNNSPIEFIKSGLSIAGGNNTIKFEDLDPILAHYRYLGGWVMTGSEQNPVVTHNEIVTITDKQFRLVDPSNNNATHFTFAITSWTAITRAGTSYQNGYRLNGTTTVNVGYGITGPSAQGAAGTIEIFLSSDGMNFMRNATGEAAVVNTRVYKWD